MRVRETETERDRDRERERERERLHLTDYSFTPRTIIKEIDTNLKDTHDESLKIQFDLQHKLQCYSTLNRTTTFANYLLIKPFKERQILSKYRLSDHDLEIERGRHRQTWTEREQRICRHCDLQQIEDEKHFLMMCPKYLHVRETFLPRFKALIPSFTELSDSEIMPFLLGEDDKTAALAAKYVLTIHNVRCSTWFTWYWPTWSFHVEWFWFYLLFMLLFIYLCYCCIYCIYIDALATLCYAVMLIKLIWIELNWIELNWIELRERERQREWEWEWDRESESERDRDRERQRQRERDRERERQREWEWEWDRESERDRDRERETERDRESESETERVRETETETEREWERERERDRERDRDSDSERETETETEREWERERGRMRVGRWKLKEHMNKKGKEEGWEVEYNRDRRKMHMRRVPRVHSGRKPYIFGRTWKKVRGDGDGGQREREIDQSFWRGGRDAVIGRSAQYARGGLTVYCKTCWYRYCGLKHWKMSLTS